MRKRAQPQKPKKRRSREYTVKEALLSVIWEELSRDWWGKPRDLMSDYSDWKRIEPDMRELVSYVSPPHPKVPKASLSVEMIKELVKGDVPLNVVLRLMASVHPCLKIFPTSNLLQFYQVP